MIFDKLNNFRLSEPLKVCNIITPLAGIMMYSSVFVVKYKFFSENTNEKLNDLNNAAMREIGRLTKGQIISLPDIYYMDKNGLLRLLWEQTKRG